MIVLDLKEPKSLDEGVSRLGEAEVIRQLRRSMLMRLAEKVCENIKKFGVNWGADGAGAVQSVRVEVDEAAGTARVVFEVEQSDEAVAFDLRKQMLALPKTESVFEAADQVGISDPVLESDLEGLSQDFKAMIQECMGT